MLSKKKPEAPTSATFESLTIKSPGSPYAVSIIPEGIWLHGEEDMVFASMHMQGKTPVLAVADHRKSGQNGHQLALSVDENGEPCLQIAKGDKIVIVGADKLFEVFG